VKITDHVKFSIFTVEDQEDRVQLGYLLDTKPIIKIKIIEEISISIYICFILNDLNYFHKIN